MKKYFHVGIGVVASVAIAALVAPVAVAAKAQCPSGGTPAPGSTINGGLEVDGSCSLSDVTVHGGIVVDGGAGLGFANGTAKGGITVNSGGELDINNQLSGTQYTGTTGSVDGGIVMTNPRDFDVDNATVNGGLQVNGDSTGASPTVCGSQINGGITVSNANTSGIYIGDPTDLTPFATHACPANTIKGGITFSHVNNGAIEGNTIDGSVTLDDSAIEFNGNTITGQRTCTNGTVIKPGEGSDPTSDTCS